MSQTNTSSTPSVEHVIETDLQAHIEDTPLYWISRNGRLVQRTWNELTAQEQHSQREAQARAEFVAVFAPCGW